MSAVTVTKKDERVVVTSPYSDIFRVRARQLGGAWKAGAWEFDARHEARVRALLNEVYGTDGTPGATATLHIDLDGLRPSGSEVVVGPIMVLKKWDRDSAPSVGDGCAVIEGALKSRGGSARYPEITWKPGTIIEVQRVPLALAQHLAANDPEAYQIAREQEPEPEPDSLTPEEAALVESLKTLPEARRALILAALGPSEP